MWDKEENLVPMFDNDHLLWTLESFLDEKHPELAAIGWLEDCEHAAVILDNKENAKPEKFARQDSTLVKRDIKEVIQMLIADAKRNTVEGVRKGRDNAGSFPIFAQTAVGVVLSGPKMAVWPSEA